MKPKHEVADVLRSYGDVFRRQYRKKVTAHQLNTLRAIEVCRTAKLGGHIDGCTNCGHVQIVYNSCRNRHCPKCQSTDREKWILNQEANLLPVCYFHVIFTLPDKLNSLCIKYPEQMYNLFFRTTWKVIDTFGWDPEHLGAQTGITSILHTWGQNISLHPHIHCIVPGGGLTVTGNWKNARSKGKYLFPAKALSDVFRAKFVAGMRKWAKEDSIHIPQSLYDSLFEKNWVVYAKNLFLGPKQVIEYIGRYSHRIAITNHRIIAIDNGKVSFKWKDYKDNDKQKEMTLDAIEFVRRFNQHILPHGFIRIRHYGILSSRNKTSMLKAARKALGSEINNDLTSIPEKEENDWKTICVERLGFDPDICPKCKKKTLIQIDIWERGRAPPSMEQAKEKLQKMILKSNTR